MRASPRLKDAHVSPVSCPSQHSHTHARACTHTQPCNPKAWKRVVGKNILWVISSVQTPCLQLVTGRKLLYLLIHSFRNHLLHPRYRNINAFLDPISTASVFICCSHFFSWYLLNTYYVLNTLPDPPPQPPMDIMKEKSYFMSASISSQGVESAPGK